MRIAVLLPNWVGDAVMATPSLGALRHQYPHATICGVMRPLIAETLSGCGFFDETIFYDRRSADVQAQFWPVSGRLRRFLPEMFISLTNSPRARLLQWLSSANETIGLKRRWYDRWLTTPVDIPSLRRHEPFSAVDTYRALMVAAGCPPADRVPRLATRPRDEIAADDAFRDLEIRPGEPVVALNTGSANGPAKDWPTESFAELARRVQSQWGAFVLILCGPAEREKARQVEAAARHPRIRSIGNRTLGIGLTKACIRRSRMVVTTDSGPRHIAAAFGIPAVSLFGPTDPRWSDNYHPREIRVHLDLDCRPCARRRCPLRHHRCMRDLPVEMVFAAMERLGRSIGIREAA